MPRVRRLFGVATWAALFTWFRRGKWKFFWGRTGRSQIGIIAGAAMFAAISLWRIWAHSVQRGIDLSRWRWAILAGICTLYLIVAVTLVTLPETPL